MRYFSMFSGIGGFEIGIQNAYREAQRRGQANPTPDDETGQGLVASQGKGTNAPNGWSSTSATDRLDQRPLCVGYSEIDKYAIKVYERHFNGHKNYGDATKINPSELPDFDLLVGGFPCQAFSVAGKRAGFNDTRGTLFFDIARILKVKRPRHLVLENVKGLLSHDTGKTFQTILKVLSDLGYRVEWQVLNSKDFGVPQNRERVIIVGHLGDGCRGQVFPIIGNGGKAIEVVGYLNSPTWQKRNESIRRVYSSEGVAPTIPTGTGGGVMPKIVSGIDLSTQEAKLTNQARTIQARYNKGYSHRKAETTGVYDGSRIRRLTPKECERLQGFPDDWTAGESDTQRYKMCGNAVTTNVIQAVMERMFEHDQS